MPGLPQRKSVSALLALLLLNLISAHDARAESEGMSAASAVAAAKQELEALSSGQKPVFAKTTKAEPAKGSKSADKKPEKKADADVKSDKKPEQRAKAKALGEEKSSPKPKKAKPKKAKAKDARSASKPSKQESKADTWFARYSGASFKLDYPTIDGALLGVLAGGSSRSTSAAGKPSSGPVPPAPMTDKNRTADGRIEPAVGAVVRRPDDPAMSVPASGVTSPGIFMAPAGPAVPPLATPRASVDEYTPVQPAGPPGLYAPLPIARLKGDPTLPPVGPDEYARRHAKPVIGQGTPDDRRYSQYYRKTKPTRGWTGNKRRVDYVPVQGELTQPDRWRGGFSDHHVHTRGKWYNPYEQNILKGDYPIYGDRTFLVLTAESQTLYEERHLPTPSNIPAARAGSFPTFGKPGQEAFRQAFVFTANVFDGDAGFEPPRWQFRVTPVFNVDNTLRLSEVGVTVTDVRAGPERDRMDVGIQELFGEVRMGVTSPFFDFVSFRLGRQLFQSDFRGFIFQDNNQALRIFGNGAANRNSYNLLVFDMVEHETNSGLLRSEANPDRGQKITIASFFRQDFWDIPGYTAGVNFHRNVDEPSFVFDLNGFLARPDAVGRFQRHEVDSKYIGVVGDGHIGRINFTHAFYHAWGTDSFNPLADKPTDIDAQMAAVEMSYDEDWIRYKLSLFYASGDQNPQDNQATGFDSIIDDVNFAGGPFSYWVRQGLRIQGVGLKQSLSLVPNLRSSKNQGQANFVNPGLQLVGLGADMEVTPKLKAIFNFNVLRFDETEALELFLFQTTVNKGVGIDYSLGAIYRPDLNQNIIATFGVAGFSPGDGFSNIYDTDKGLYHAFTELKLVF